METTAGPSSSALIEITSDELHWRLPGTIIGTPGKKLTLRTDQELPVSSPVKIQAGGDLMYLGEVLSCFQHDQTSWEVSVSVKRRLMVL